MSVITVRFPDDHPINDTLKGKRSDRIRELVDIGLKVEHRNEEILLQLEEIKGILERVNIEPATVNNYTLDKKDTDKELNKIKFDLDAFTEL